MKGFLKIAPLLLFACSGAKDLDLFNGPGTAKEPNEPAASARPPQETSSTPPSAGGPATQKDAGVEVDAAAPPPPALKTIECAKKPCNADTQVCCAKWNELSGKATFRCEARGPSACSDAMTVACDDRTDCPEGQVCCGVVQPDIGYGSVLCRSSCESGPLVQRIRLCDPHAAQDECAEIGKSCRTADQLQGYYVCY